MRIYTDMLNEFTDECVSHEGSYKNAQKRAQSSYIRMLRSSMGLATLSGRILGYLNSFMWKGKLPDRILIKKDLAEIIGFTANMCDQIGISFTDIIEEKLTDMDKLKINIWSWIN